MLAFTISAALYCSLSRVFLVTLDRWVFRGTKNFNLQIFLNSLYPFLLSLLFALAFSEVKLLKQFILSPNVIVHALLSFLAAWSVSAGLRCMEVRYVVVVSKLADIAIPVASFMVYSKLLAGWELSLLTLLAYIPILRSGLTTKSIDVKVSILIVGTIVVQSLVNKFFSFQYEPNIEYFLAYIACILLWRLVFCTLAVSKKIESFSFQDIIDNKLLVVRSLLAWSSQASFFLALLDPSNLYVWPIINTTPLISMIVSHIVLQERASRSENISLVILGLITSFYFARVVL